MLNSCEEDFDEVRECAIDTFTNPIDRSVIRAVASGIMNVLQWQMLLQESVIEKHVVWSISRNHKC